LDPPSGHGAKPLRRGADAVGMLAPLPVGSLSEVIERVAGTDLSAWFNPFLAQFAADAESRGIEIIGVFHSHTHTDAYPSPTDVAQATDPGWHYVLVSLRDTHPVVRSYLIRDGQITEEPVEVPGLEVPGLEVAG